MADFSAYVDLPYSPRLDCYGLVRKVLREVAGVALPDYRYPHDGDARAGFVEQLRQEVGAGWQQVERPRPLDVVLLNIDGQPRHVGLVVGRGRMLHTDSHGGRSRIERFDSGLHQVAGFYRWGVA
jgi:cell wall-associated NlpC family hydrolase